MDNSTAFWNIIFPTISPFAIIIVFFLLWRIIRRLEQRKWKLITARVLRIEKIDKKDRDGVLEPRQYKLDLVFQWQGVDWHRSWIFPRIYDLPKAGDILQLRYHPQKEDFQLVTSLAEKQKIRHARLVLLLVIGIVIFVPSVLFGLLLFHLPQEQHILSESTVWLFFAAPLLVIFLVVRIYRAAAKSNRENFSLSLRESTDSAKTARAMFTHSVSSESTVRKKKLPCPSSIARIMKSANGLLFI